MQAKITSKGMYDLKRWLSERHKNDNVNVEAFAAEAEDRWEESENVVQVELNVWETVSGNVETFSPEFQIWDCGSKQTEKLTCPTSQSIF